MVGSCTAPGRCSCARQKTGRALSVPDGAAWTFDCSEILRATKSEGAVWQRSHPRSIRVETSSRNPSCRLASLSRVIRGPSALTPNLALDPTPSEDSGHLQGRAQCPQLYRRKHPARALHHKQNTSPHLDELLGVPAPSFQRHGCKHTTSGYLGSCWSRSMVGNPLIREYSPTLLAIALTTCAEDVIDLRASAISPGFLMIKLP